MDAKTLIKTMTMMTVVMTGCALMAAQGPDATTGKAKGRAAKCEAECRGPKAQRMPPPMNMGNWMGRFISQPDTLDRLGVTNAETRAAIVTALAKIDEQMKTLGKKIRATSMDQAKLVPSVLEKPGADPKELFARIDEIGAMRIEQAKLSTQVMLVLRDKLTDEQRDAVKEMMETEGGKRFRARQQFNEELGKRQPRLNRRGEGRRGKGRRAQKAPPPQGDDDDAPQAGAPQGEGPQGDGPQVGAPQGDGPQGDGPQAGAPQGDGPQGDGPQAAEPPPPPADDAE